MNDNLRRYVEQKVHYLLQENATDPGTTLRLYWSPELVVHADFAKADNAQRACRLKLAELLREIADHFDAEEP